MEDAAPELTRAERIRRLAEALGFEVPPGTVVVVEKDSQDSKWWICGAKGGDCVLPGTRKCLTIDSAIEAAEAWLAMEVGQLVEEKFPKTHRD